MWRQWQIFEKIVVSMSSSLNARKRLVRAFQSHHQPNLQALTTMFDVISSADVLMLFCWGNGFVCLGCCFPKTRFG
jgi:hypothetical protein